MNAGCKKCGDKMPPVKSGGIGVFVPHGYLCNCGHRNRLTTRRGFKEWEASIKKGEVVW